MPTTLAATVAQAQEATVSTVAQAQAATDSIDAPAQTQGFFGRIFSSFKKKQAPGSIYIS